MSDQYIYVFVRKDLSIAQQIIQVSHASSDMAWRKASDQPSETPNVCLFQVENERELVAVAQCMKRDGVEHEMFYERDHDTGYTALATVPIRGEQRLLFKDYRKYE